MLVGDRADLANLVDDLGRRLGVVPHLATDQNAGIERTAADDAGAGGPAGWKQVVKRCLLQQRIASCQKEDVSVADADRFDKAGAAKLFHGPVAALGEVAEVAGILVAMSEGADVMRQQNVDPVETKPLQTVLEGAQDGVIAIVIDHMEGQRLDHAEFCRVRHRPQPQQTPDFVRKHIVGWRSRSPITRSDLPLFHGDNLPYVCLPAVPGQMLRLRRRCFIPSCASGVPS